MHYAREQELSGDMTFEVACPRESIGPSPGEEPFHRAVGEPGVSGPPIGSAVVGNTGLEDVGGEFGSKVRSPLHRVDNGTCAMVPR